MSAFAEVKEVAHHAKKTADPFRSTVRERRISDVAVDCGFNDLSYFNRCFRRRFGLTPTAARGR